MKRSPAQPSPAEARRVLAEVARRADALRRVDFETLCFPAQRAFVEDDSPFVAGLCGRRAGKSDGAVLKCLRGAQRHEGAIIPYIALSRPHAKRIVWPKLLYWNRRLGLGAKFNHAELTMTFPHTGSQIVLGGANDDAEIERYRGGAYPMVVLDEAQAFRPFIFSFIVEILMPALLDYGGQVVLIGTPTPHCHGLFHDVTNGEGVRTVEADRPLPDFRTHRWTGFDNPNLDETYRRGEHSDTVRALDRAKAKIDALSAATGLTPAHPEYRREWLAEWAASDTGLVYEVKPHTVVRELPDHDDLRYVLGMDVGFVDATAFVVMAYSLRAGCAWVLESHQQTEMLPSQQAAEVMRLSQRYDFESVVIDPGGGGKGLIEELAQRHGVPARSAEKTEKVAAIGTLNGDLRANVLRIYGPANQDLLHDLSQLKWDYARLKKKGGAQWESKPISALAIDDRTPDHLADAFLYAHRECQHYLNEWKRDNPTEGSAEWWQAQEDAMLAKVTARQRRAEGPWWEAPPPPEDP